MIKKPYRSDFGGIYEVFKDGAEPTPSLNTITRHFFYTHEKYVLFYEQANDQKQLDAATLYRRGLEFFC